MITQSQLIDLVQNNMHLFNFQYQTQSNLKCPLQKQIIINNNNSNNNNHQNNNIKETQKVNSNVNNSLKLDLWKVNKSLNIQKKEKKDQQIGPILSFQRRNIWSRNSPNNNNNSNVKQKLYSTLQPKHEYKQQQSYLGEEQNMFRTIGHLNLTTSLQQQQQQQQQQQKCNNNNNNYQSKNIQPQHSSLYSTIQRYPQQQQQQQQQQQSIDYQQRHYVPIKREKYHQQNIGVNQSQYRKLQTNCYQTINRVNNLLGKQQQFGQRRYSALKRRKKIFSLPSHQNNNNNTNTNSNNNINNNQSIHNTTITQSFSKNIRPSSSPKIYPSPSLLKSKQFRFTQQRQPNNSITQIQKQNLNLNMNSTSHYHQSHYINPSQQQYTQNNNKHTKKRHSLLQTDYLPSPSQLTTILKTIQKHSRYIPDTKIETRKSLRDKKQRISIRYHDSVQYQSIQSFQQPSRNVFIPVHPQVFNPGNMNKGNDIQKSKIKFNYVDSSYRLDM